MLKRLSNTGWKYIDCYLLRVAGKILFKLPHFILPIIVSVYCHGQTSSWLQAEETGGAVIDVYWRPTMPFIYEENGKMNGLEAELLQEFRLYVQSKYHIRIEYNWKEPSSFSDTWNNVVEQNGEGAFGLAAFSMTEERKQAVDFAGPYMKDISVLISGKDVPIVNTIEQFKSVFAELKAVTHAGTVFESDLKNLRDSMFLNYDINYLPNNTDVIGYIENNGSTFGFIDLPVYMSRFTGQTTLTNVKRQNLFTIPREGYSIILTKGSDWLAPMRAFMSDKNNKELFERLASKYFEINIYKFMEEIALGPTPDIMLLTHEKEILDNELVTHALSLERTKYIRNLFIVITITVLVFVGFLGWIYIIKLKQNKLLVSQNAIIKKQRKALQEQQGTLEDQKNELEKTLGEVRQVNTEKNNLIRVLAHDIRTPVNHILGFLNLWEMEQEGKLPMEGTDYKSKIRSTCHHVLHMATNILDVELNDPRKIKLDPVVVRLSELAKNIEENFSIFAREKGIKLNIKVDSKRKTIRKDETILVHILNNLISNAIKFSGRGTTVTVGFVDYQDDRIRIDVTDQGPGFTKEDKEKLFKKYQRLSAQPTEGEKSTGLGLSIVKLYTEVLGGEVSYSSEVGRGTVFSIILPVGRKITNRPIQAINPADKEAP